MNCGNCGSEWSTSKTDITNCPFCGAMLFDVDKAANSTDIVEFLKYVYITHGEDVFKNHDRLNGIILDMYKGEERYNRLYRRLISENQLPLKLLSLKDKSESELTDSISKLSSDMASNSFIDKQLAKSITMDFAKALGLINADNTNTNELNINISTIATEEDGAWIDKFGVKYSADRRKLIKALKPLEDYTIPEGTMVICDGAFFNVGVKSISIPSSVVEIGDGILDRFSSIDTSNNNRFVFEDGLFYSKSGKLIVCSKDVADYVDIPLFITEIGTYTFKDCDKLEYVNIPHSVTRIGQGAFYNCEKLTSINQLPAQVTIIKDKTFYNCKSLKSINIPYCVLSIGKYAFYNCEHLEKIIIPGSVTEIGDDTFKYCDNLIEIFISDSITTIGKYVFWGCKNLNKIIIPKGSKAKFERLISEYKTKLVEA